MNARIVSKLIAALLVLVGCVYRPTSPRFGGLRAEDQAFRFAHSIELYQVANGLTVVLVPDPRTNLVTVDARYRVGAADDPAGRAGLAHLVEHLTFQAVATPDGATLGDRLGDLALEHNAFTTHDITHYTATALATRLPELIEVEAQRLEITCAQLDDDVFIRERDVVLEEDAERRSPWSEVHAELSAAWWGPRHPYARPIGGREVAAATKDEACRFLADHYVPERAVIVVTGDFDAARMATAIGERFVRVPPRAAPPRLAIEEARFTGARTRHQADVDDATAIIAFPAPAWGAPDTAAFVLMLERLSQVMGAADLARDWIIDTSVSTDGAGRARLVVVTVTVSEPARLEAAADEVFARTTSLFEEVSPYTAANLVGRLQADYAARYETFAARGRWLADYVTFTGHRGFMAPDLDGLAAATLPAIERYTADHLRRDRSHVALIEPTRARAGAAADRVEVAAGPELDLPAWRVPVDTHEAERPLAMAPRKARAGLEEATLDNGLRVVLAPDPGSALIEARLVFPHGIAGDPPAQPGRALAAAELLEHDLDRQYRPGDAFLLGWGLGTGTIVDSDIDEVATSFKVRGTFTHAAWHVWRLSWLLDQGVYRGATVRGLRDAAARARAETDPGNQRLLEALFGAGHPYVDLGAPARWGWLERDALEAYRREHFVPRGATLIIAGNFEVEAMRGVVQALFGPWADRAPAPAVHFPPVRPRRGPTWIGTRDPGRVQVGLTVAFATTSDPDADRAARLILREVLLDRLRLVRERMGASYGVGVDYAAGTGGGMVHVTSALDPERAARAAAAVLAELEAVRTGAAAMTADFVRARRRALAAVMGGAAGVSAVADELELAARRGQPFDHLDRLARAIAAATPAEVAAVAQADLAAARRVVKITADPARLAEVLAAVGATDPILVDKEP